VVSCMAINLAVPTVLLHPERVFISL